MRKSLRDGASIAASPTRFSGASNNIPPDLMPSFLPGGAALAGTAGAMNLLGKMLQNDRDAQH